ncbi:DUF6894 family protein [Devosia sp. LjRoot3]|uniref:DUF6894 family protein n=1 Tax=Devosia sp. LjRoot3 TaxID=3342319 RepID=UPI003ED11C13
MPMYFFDVLERDGTITHDVIGVKLDCPDQALDVASRTLISVLQDEAMRHPEFKVQIVVREDAGNEIGRRDAIVSQSDQAD